MPLPTVHHFTVTHLARIKFNEWNMRNETNCVKYFECNNVHCSIDFSLHYFALYGLLMSITSSFLQRKCKEHLKWQRKSDKFYIFISNTNWNRVSEKKQKHAVVIFQNVHEVHFGRTIILCLSPTFLIISCCSTRKFVHFIWNAYRYIWVQHFFRIFKMVHCREREKEQPALLPLSTNKLFIFHSIWMCRLGRLRSKFSNANKNTCCTMRISQQYFICIYVCACLRVHTEGNNACNQTNVM